VAKSKIIEYLLVDGYNIIFAWDDISKIADTSLDHARKKLIDILSNFQGYTKEVIIIVFDAHKVNEGKGSVETHNNITVVYTKEKQTADIYIEKVVKEFTKKYKVRVATSDVVEQIIVMGSGAELVSATGLYREVRSINKRMETRYMRDIKPVKNNMLIDNLDEKTAKLLESMRMGKGSV